MNCTECKTGTLKVYDRIKSMPGDALLVCNGCRTWFCGIGMRPREVSSDQCSLKAHALPKKVVKDDDVTQALAKNPPYQFEDILKKLKTVEDWVVDDKATSP